MLWSKLNAKWNKKNRNYILIIKWKIWIINMSLSIISYSKLLNVEQ